MCVIIVVLLAACWLNSCLAFIPGLVSCSCVVSDFGDFCHNLQSQPNVFSVRNQDLIHFWNIYPLHWIPRFRSLYCLKLALTIETWRKIKFFFFFFFFHMSQLVKCPKWLIVRGSQTKSPALRSGQQCSSLRTTFVNRLTKDFFIFHMATQWKF